MAWGFERFLNPRGLLSIGSRLCPNSAERDTECADSETTGGSSEPRRPHPSKRLIIKKKIQWKIFTFPMTEVCRYDEVMKRETQFL
jgi:hypothetical protein